MDVKSEWANDMVPSVTYMIITRSCSVHFAGDNYKRGVMVELTFITVSSSLYCHFVQFPSST